MIPAVKYLLEEAKRYKSSKRSLEEAASMLQDEGCKCALMGLPFVCHAWNNVKRHELQRVLEEVVEYLVPSEAGSDATPRGDANTFSTSASQVKLEEDEVRDSKSWNIGLGKSRQV